MITIKIKSRCVCETLQYAPGDNKVEKAIFSFKVKVKITRSLTLVSFERVSVCMPNMKSLSLCGSKVIAKVKVDNRQTGQKQYAPDHLIRGHKNVQKYGSSDKIRTIALHKCRPWQMQ